MQANREHGTGASPEKKRKGEGKLRPAVQRDPPTLHPALIALVRLLARQAAAECLTASGGFSSLPEKADDQDTQF